MSEKKDSVYKKKFDFWLKAFILRQIYEKLKWFYY